MIQYREVQADEINRGLFKDFIRRQVVTKCWRKENGIWVIREDPFTDDWSESDYRILISCLRNTVQTGGFVYAAFYMDMLKGFVSAEAELFGEERKYVDLSSIHVSEDMRNHGIGTRLFLAAKEWAGKEELINFISLLIRRLRARPFTKKWAAQRRRYAFLSIQRQNRMTVSWNVIFRKTML